MRNNKTEEPLPSVRIKNAWLLRENVSRHLHELWGEGKVLADDEWMEWKVGEYEKAWQPYEQKILHGMIEILGLSFRQNIIDVYIAPWFHAFSDPLVIGVMQEPDVFVDTLTHELVHIPVHAVHQAIYLNVLKEPERLRRDIARNKRHHATPYIAAWEYIEANGYKDIIKQLRKSYETYG